MFSEQEEDEDVQRLLEQKNPRERPRVLSQSSEEQRLFTPCVSLEGSNRQALLRFLKIKRIRELHSKKL